MSVILQFISYTPLSKWQQMNNLKSVDGQYCKQEKKNGETIYVEPWKDYVTEKINKLRTWGRLKSILYFHTKYFFYNGFLCFNLFNTLWSTARVHFLDKQFKKYSYCLFCWDLD